MNFETLMAAPEEVPAENNNKKIEEMLDKKVVFSGDIPIPQEVLDKESEDMGQMLDRKERFMGDVKVPALESIGGDNIDINNLKNLSNQELATMEMGKPVIVDVESEPNRDIAQGIYRFGNFQGFDGKEVAVKLLDGKTIKLPPASVYRYDESRRNVA